MRFGCFLLNMLFIYGWDETRVICMIHEYWTSVLNMLIQLILVPHVFENKYTF
jgi:hypothetical protein